MQSFKVCMAPREEAYKCEMNDDFGSHNMNFLYDH